MATTGYIKLSRNLFKNPFWTEERQFSKCEAWIDLIQSARVEQSSVIINNKLIEVQRGQVPASIRYLAKRWSWGEQKVRTYLKLLIDCAMITQQQHRGETIITLVNYGTYNDKQHSNEVENNTRITQGQHTDNTGITQSIKSIRSKELEELNNEKKEGEISAKAEPPPRSIKKNLDVSIFLEKLPFQSENFKQKFLLLLAQKKWKSKTDSAVWLAIEKMAKYKEEFVVDLMEKAIIGNWQGLFFSNTDDDYKKYLLKISNNGNSNAHQQTFTGGKQTGADLLTAKLATNIATFAARGTENT